MPSDFSQVFAALDRLPDRVAQGAAAGLDAEIPSVQAALVTAAHQKMKGQTGATFAGTVVYAGGAGVEGSGLFNEAVAAVRDRNPAHVHVESVEGGGEETITVIATVPTDYQQLLETGTAGDKGFLGELLGYSQSLLAAAARGIAGVMR